MKYLALTLALLISGAAFAVQPSEMLKDPTLEARARDVSKGLRCVVCQNESIDESNAEIAHDMRLLVRERITAGDTNQQIVDYMVSRYGDYVLLKPRFTSTTLLLWTGPFIILLIGGFIVAARLRSPGVAAAPLSPEEQAALAAINTSEDKLP
jgi:cytochrome c-type biogenesis protein CcmH